MRLTRPGRTFFRAVLLASFASSATGATLTVTNTNDSGAGSLRQAILDANGNVGADTIAFNIVGSGVQTIAPAAALPQITDGVTIDGYTQPGASPNTNAPDQGTNAVLLIEIDGTNTGTGSEAAVLFFAPGGGGSAVRGLVINRGKWAGIRISGVAGMTIDGNFIGTDPTGTVPHGNADFGIQANNGPSSITIGGTTPAARNLISGNGMEGVNFGAGGNGGTGHLIQGNLIGTDATGGNAIPGAQVGVEVDSSASANITIGGTSAASRNVISGNGSYGVRLNNGSALVVTGNFIGTDVTGTAPLGNATYGVFAEANAATIGGSAAGAGNVVSANGTDGMSINGAGITVQGNLVGTDLTGQFALGNGNRGMVLYGANALVGGAAPGEGNIVAHNATAGVVVLGNGALGNAIRGNSIFANGTIGIDLASDGVTANDDLDADTGPNNRQNYPIVISAVPLVPSGTHVLGTFDSAPSTSYTLDFFVNPACAARPHDFTEGLLYLGSVDVATDGAGHVAVDETLAYTIEAGQPVTITATDPAGNTSELSPRIVFSINPTSGPAGGGTLFAVRGTDFKAGLTITVGGLPATDILLQSSTQVEGRSPALPAGSLGDVVLTNLDTTTGTLPKGWVADFLDVPLNQTFHSYVITLVTNAITAGVGGGNYGVANNTLRQQMAVFLLKAKYGACYVPPPCTGIFGDVSCTPGSGFGDWIEALAALGITGGCGSGNFCPTTPVRRDQMAAFLLKTEHGSTYVPPTCAGIFTDVVCPSTFANWIERLAAEQITGGCGTGIYCPLNNNTRGQMAVFIVKTFNLQ